MTSAAAFRELLGELDRLNIPYLVTGSVAISFHANYRPLVISTDLK